MKGKVLKSTGSWYNILEDDTRRVYECRVRGKLKLKGVMTTNPIAVGDIVIFDEDEAGEDGQGIISDIVPRINYVIRKSVHKEQHAHILAANVDQAMLMVTLSMPRTSMGFIERFLVNTESFRIPAILVFNKMDLLDEETEKQQEEWIAIYESVGFECLSISAKHGDRIPEVVSRLMGKVTLLAGHSGVGKSTLVNHISPEVSQQIKEISDFSLKGQHATTFAEMFEIAENSFLIDTPGIKELGIIDMEPWEVSHYYPEMRTILGECRFNNCLHLTEPGCAVKEAVSKGEIQELRYKSYQSIMEDEDNRR